MLRDERLQKVVAEIDSAPDRERVGSAGRGQVAAVAHGGGGLGRARPPSTDLLWKSCRPLSPCAQALVRALQAPNFKEFADKVR